jgi:hypothetical protein
MTDAPTITPPSLHEFGLVRSSAPMVLFSISSLPLLLSFLVKMTL